MATCEFKRNLTIDDTYQIIVLGGGPAGCAAAAAAGREDAKTLLIEVNGCLGGMGTAGLVPGWCGFSNGGDLCSTGIGKTVLERTNAQMYHVVPGIKGRPIDPEALKRVYDELVTENGCVVLFHTMFTAVETDGNGSVLYIVTTNKNGLNAYSADVYVDCTGDADLCAWAGADFQKGGETGDLAPATHCFTLSNVDMYKYMVKKPPNGMAGPDPKYPLIIDSHSGTALAGPGTVGMNAGHIHGVDSTDPASVSRAMMTGRKLAHQLQQQLKERQPELFGNAFLAQTAQVMGARESRRIEGDYTLTTKDYYDRAVFPDEIARNCYELDSHSSLREVELMRQGKLGYIPEDNPYSPGESHGIPYRCLTPKTLKNVLVAGRSISAERRVMGSIRVMAPCLAMGEAAGIAAKLASEMKPVDVHTVDTDALRARLKEVGAYIK